MKKLSLLLTLAVVLMVSSAFASTITFQWDANTEADLNHYDMYQCTTGSAPCSKIPVVGTGCTGVAQPAGTTVTCILTFTLAPNTEETRHYAVTASDNNSNESQTSNIVTQRVDNKPPGPPGTTPTGALKIIGFVP